MSRDVLVFEGICKKHGDVSARLFRVGFLLTGVRPSLKAILRQARLDG